MGIQGVDKFLDSHAQGSVDFTNDGQPGLSLAPKDTGQVGGANARGATDGRQAYVLTGEGYGLRGGPLNIATLIASWAGDIHS